MQITSCQTVTRPLQLPQGFEPTELGHGPSTNSQNNGGSRPPRRMTSRLSPYDAMLAGVQPG